MFKRNVLVLVTSLLLASLLLSLIAGKRDEFPGRRQGGGGGDNGGSNPQSSVTCDVKPIRCEFPDRAKKWNI